MTEPQPDPFGDWVRQMNTAFQPLVTAISDAMTTFGRVVKEWSETPQGRETLALARYLAENPDVKEALLAGQKHTWDCHCLCSMQGHHGVCTGGPAETFRTFDGLGRPHEVPMCVPCATDLDAKASR